MEIGKKSVCLVCGAAVIAGSYHSHPECRPTVELCAPAAIHQTDLPQREPGPVRTLKLSVVASTTSSASFDLPGFVLRRSQ